MEIRTNTHARYSWTDLRCIPKGSAVFFEAQFHQDMSISDPYIVIDASAYPAFTPRSGADPGSNTGKIAAVNLVNGKLSYLDRGRRVRLADAFIGISP